jgi:hypothetical protein
MIDYTICMTFSRLTSFKQSEILNISEEDYLIIKV